MSTKLESGNTSASSPINSILRKWAIIIGLIELIILLGCVIATFILYILASGELSDPAGITDPPSTTGVTSEMVMAEIDDEGEYALEVWNDKNGETSARDLAMRVNIKHRYYMRSLGNAVSTLALCALIIVLMINGAIGYRPNWMMLRLVVQVAAMLALLLISIFNGLSCSCTEAHKNPMDVVAYFTIGIAACCWVTFSISMLAFCLEVLMFICALKQFRAIKNVDN